MYKADSIYTIRTMPHKVDTTITVRLQNQLVVVVVVLLGAAGIPVPAIRETYQAPACIYKTVDSSVHTGPGTCAPIA